MKRVLIGLVLLGVSFVRLQEAPPKRSLGVASVTYVVEVDPARAHAAGWTADGASDAQAVEAAIGVVRRRLTAMQREVALQAQPDSRRFELRMPQVQPRDRDLVRELIESVGLCEFLTVAEQASAGINLATAELDVEAWREANPGRPLEECRTQGASERLVWLDSDFDGTKGRPMPALLPDSLEDYFGAGSLSRVFASQDAFGYPAIGFELPEARSADFEHFTGERVGQRLAIVIEGRLRSAPTLNTKLKSSGIIEGRFKDDEVKRLGDGITRHASPLKLLEIK